MRIRSKAPVRSVCKSTKVNTQVVANHRMHRFWWEGAERASYLRRRCVAVRVLCLVVYDEVNVACHQVTPAQLRTLGAFSMVGVKTHPATWHAALNSFQLHRFFAYKEGLRRLKARVVKAMREKVSRPLMTVVPHVVIMW